MSSGAIGGRPKATGTPMTESPRTADVGHAAAQIAARRLGHVLKLPGRSSAAQSAPADATIDELRLSAQATKQQCAAAWAATCS